MKNLTLTVNVENENFTVNRIYGFKTAYGFFDKENAIFNGSPKGDKILCLYKDGSWTISNRWPSRTRPMWHDFAGTMMTIGGDRNKD